MLVDVSAAQQWSTAPTINNTISSSIAPGLATWDPADEVTITGQLRRSVGPNFCTDMGSYIYIFDALAVRIVDANPAFGLGPGHMRCEGYPDGFYPGADLDGNFSFTMKGGGTSWSAGDGTQLLGSYVQLEFQAAHMLDFRYVICGNSSDYAALSGIGCPSAPEIYGRLASPDLTGDTAVDAADLVALAAYLGLPITLVSGWQADFNHSGFSVDAGDLSYFAGRLGKNCNSKKAGEGDYAMDVRNLADPAVLEFLARYGMNATSVIAKWEEMNLSYDREAARSIAADDANGSVQVPWRKVKAFYRE